MKSRDTGILLVMLFIVLALIGCVRVRTYTVTKPRVDQDSSGGNAGYFISNPSAPETNQPRRLTRQTYVTEVEFGSASKSNKKQACATTPAAVETVQEPAVTTEVAASKPPAVTSYTVENNDTLQKISLKVYGTSKKWKKIYEANADKLKSPEKIYAGQVLTIPQE